LSVLDQVGMSSLHPYVVHLVYIHIYNHNNNHAPNPTQVWTWNALEPLHDVYLSPSHRRISTSDRELAILHAASTLVQQAEALLLQARRGLIHIHPWQSTLRQQHAATRATSSVSTAPVTTCLESGGSCPSSASGSSSRAASGHDSFFQGHDSFL
jgi:hypothetical protein